MIIGTMSGTSMNSFDIVAVEFEQSMPVVKAAGSYQLPDDYKAKYLTIINNQGQTNLAELGELNTWTGIVFAKLINQFIADNNLDKNKISAIASPGQTIWHMPNATWPFTLQLGDPNFIAENTGLTTVADFRNSDIAAGGQGAPLAPAFHRAVFADVKQTRCVVNIGGFSNISILENNKYLGFDTGPGNCLLDYWVNTYFNKPYDANGEIASSGVCITELLELLLNDPYFTKPAPKSTGHEYFNSVWLNNKLKNFTTSNFKTEDILATLVSLTAQSIATAIKTHAQANTQIYVCGGGAHNSAVLRALSTSLEQQVQTTSILGIEPDWVEAVMSAWLAKQRLEKQPIDLRLITGARHPAILGAVYT